MDTEVKVEEYRTGLNENLRQATLCFLVEEKRILLAMKKRGFGKGKWNGVGGKVNPGESVEQAMIRETKEEIGVVPKSMWKVAELEFYFYNEDHRPNQMNMKVTTYFCDQWDGEPSESEEMAPRWFENDSLPFDSMWPDDRFWVPNVIKGKYLEGYFLFGKDDLLIDHFVVEKGISAKSPDSALSWP